MKSIKASSVSAYLAGAICICASDCIAQPLNPSETQILQAEEISERLNLYKRIKDGQNKKALMQLLHDIADIKKQCKDKGYLCEIGDEDTFNMPILIDLNQPPQPTEKTSPSFSPEHNIAPDFNLLGIVGNRARFELTDGRIADFSVGEPIAYFWKVAEITPQTALLIDNRQPEIKVRYQIYTKARDDNPETTTSVR